jgi:DNA-binding NtrC family response regulator
MNVRELRNLAQRLTLMKDPVISLEDLTPFLQAPRASAKVEASRALQTAPPRALIENALSTNDGNMKKAAEALGTHRTQLYRWLDAHGIDASSFRRK